MKGLIGEEETNKIVKKSLYIVVAGSDDLCNTYYMLKIPRKIQYNVDSYTNLMVDGASNFVSVSISIYLVLSHDHVLEFKLYARITYNI